MAGGLILAAFMGMAEASDKDLQPLSDFEKRKMVADTIEMLELRIARSIARRDEEELRYATYVATGYMHGLMVSSNIDLSCRVASQTIKSIGDIAIQFVAKGSREYKLLEGEPYRESTRKSAADATMQFREQVRACWKDVGLGTPTHHLPDNPLEGVN